MAASPYPASYSYGATSAHASGMTSQHNYHSTARHAPYHSQVANGQSSHNVPPSSLPYPSQNGMASSDPRPGYTHNRSLSLPHFVRSQATHPPRCRITHIARMTRHTLSWWFKVSIRCSIPLLPSAHLPVICAHSRSIVSMTSNGIGRHIPAKSRSCAMGVAARPSRGRMH
jgi:hypothetical protein